MCVKHVSVFAEAIQATLHVTKHLEIISHLFSSIGFS